MLSRLPPPASRLPPPGYWNQAPVQSTHFPPSGSSPPAACGVCASTHLAASFTESSPWCAGPKPHGLMAGQDRRQALRNTRAGLRGVCLRASANARSLELMMYSLHALLVSTGTVALAEIGDKTQLLALLLAARFRKTWPIAFGILTATVINHAISAWLGAELSEW